MTLDLLRRQFSYDRWANREALRALATADVPEARNRLAHIVSAQQLWLERIQGVPQSLPVWPEWALKELEEQLERVAGRWEKHLAACDAAELDRQIDYKNSTGEAWRSRVLDILQHLVMHGAYHRGQIALLLRASGAEPASTDFIHGVRQSLIDD